MFIRICIVAIVVLLMASSAFACRCFTPGGGACQDYWVNSAVFSGRVVQIEDIRQGAGEDYYITKKVRFAVIDAFRGVTGKTVEVHTGSGGGDCGYKFELNESYLVYAFERERGLSTGKCSRTRPLSEALEDLNYIRGLANAGLGARLSGKVVMLVPPRSNGEHVPPPPVPNVRISIENDKNKFVTVTDAEGNFSLKGLPAGEYTVWPAVPPGYYNRAGSTPVKVFDKGCAYTWFVFEAETPLKGRLLSEDPVRSPTGKSKKVTTKKT